MSHDHALNLLSPEPPMGGDDNAALSPARSDPRQALPARNTTRRASSSCTTSVLPGGDSQARQLGGEGRLDLDFQIVMTVAPHVRTYREQPETFRWHDGSANRRYTPDGFAETTFGNFYFEVKPKRKLARDADLTGRLPWIIEQCALRGARFEIVTEDDIRTGHLLANSTRIWSAKSQYNFDACAAACAKLRDSRHPSTLGDIRRDLATLPPRIAYALIGHRYLAVDLYEPLDEQAAVFRGSQPWP